MADDERRVIVEGIAAFAVSICEMGASEDEFRAAIANQLLQLNESADARALLSEAARAILSFPEPLDESPEDLERARPIREMLGVPSASEQLAATLRARERLEGFAASLPLSED